MTKCSNYAHDKALFGGIAVPDPDELFEDITSLERWRLQIEERSKSTVKNRKAGIIATATPAEPV